MLALGGFVWLSVSTCIASFSDTTRPYGVFSESQGLGLLQIVA